MIKNLLFKGINLRYRTEGEGSALLLLHGFCESLEIWDSFIPSLSEKYRVIAPDLPGFGESGVWGEIHSMEQMAEAVNAVLEEEKISSCVMVGHSMGGYVTMAFAEHYPGKIAGAGLFHSSSYPDSVEKREDRNRSIAAVKSSHTSFVSELIPKLFAATNREQFHSEIEKLKGIAAAGSPQGIIAALAGMRDRSDRSGVLSGLQVPVLFIFGKDDAVLPLEKVISQVFITRTQLTDVLDKAGHMGFIEEKDETLQVVDQFAAYCFAN